MAQNFTNFSGTGGANEPTSYLASDGFVGAPVSPVNLNSPTFASATFPSGQIEQTGTVTAHSGGGRTSASNLSSSANVTNIATVAAPGDSVLLPAATAGQYHYVINSGANAAQVFATGSDTIDGIAGSIGVSLGIGDAVQFISAAAGAWETIGDLQSSSQVPAAVSYSAAVNTTGFTATGAQISGGYAKVVLNLTGTLGGGAALTLPTVAALVTAMEAAGIVPAVGVAWELEVQNNSSANFAWTLTTNTGWTLTGTAQTIAQTTCRKFLITLASLTTATSQSLGQFAISAAP